MRPDNKADVLHFAFGLMDKSISRRDLCAELEPSSSFFWCVAGTVASQSTNVNGSSNACSVLSVIP